VLHGLVPNTRHEYRAVVVHSGGTLASGRQRFDTLPEVRGASARRLDGSSALLDAEFAGGTLGIVRVEVRWGDGAGLVLGGEAYTRDGFQGLVLDGLQAGRTYRVRIEVENESGGRASYELEYMHPGELVFFTVGPDDEPLVGVEFTLFCCPGGEPGHEHSWLAGQDDSCWRAAMAVESDSRGLVRFADVGPGRYMLAETRTLPGYQLPLGQWLVDVDDSMRLTITPHRVDPGSLLPSFRHGTTSLGDSGYLLPNLSAHGVPISESLTLVAATIAACTAAGAATIAKLFSQRRTKHRR